MWNRKFQYLCPLKTAYQNIYRKTHKKEENKIYNFNKGKILNSKLVNFTD